jgi:hypothetical protein
MARLHARRVGREPMPVRSASAFIPAYLRSFAFPLPVAQGGARAGLVKGCQADVRRGHDAVVRAGSLCWHASAARARIGCSGRCPCVAASSLRHCSCYVILGGNHKANRLVIGFLEAHPKLLRNARQADSIQRVSQAASGTDRDDISAISSP